MQQERDANLRIAIPTGRPEAAVLALLSDAGIHLGHAGRSYRPQIGLEHVEVKRLKPRSVAEMLAQNVRDLGFTGADWAYEAGGNLIELCDTGLDPVTIVAAAPGSLSIDEAVRTGKRLRIASEYQRLTTAWAKQKRLEIEFIPSRGTTEVLPPEDADAVVDCTSTGQTLAANSLLIVEEIFTSSTRLYASLAAMDNPLKRQRIEDLAMMVGAARDARERVMLELNCESTNMEGLLRELPSMRSPTISRLNNDAWFAIKTSILRRDLATLIPRIKALGGSDLIVSRPFMVIP